MFKMSRLERDGAMPIDKSSVCFLPISVGQPYHQGAEWDETITLINGSFGACVIVVVDELHRFTEKMRDSKLTDEETRNQALQSGEEWIRDTKEQWERKKNKKRSKAFHPGLTIPYTITRWTDWTRLDGYQEKKRDIDTMYLYKDESDFHTFVDLVILTFINGFRRSQEKTKSNKVIKFDLDAAQDLSRRYLLEELAVVAMWRDKILPDLEGIPPSLLEGDAPFYMAYPFGYNSTNKDVFNCFGQLCADKLILLNLHKPTKQKSSPERSTDITVEPTSVSLERTNDEEEKKPHILLNTEVIDNGIGYLQGGMPSPRAVKSCYETKGTAAGPETNVDMPDGATTSRRETSSIATAYSKSLPSNTTFLPPGSQRENESTGSVKLTTQELEPASPGKKSGFFHGPSAAAQPKQNRIIAPPRGVH